MWEVDSRSAYKVRKIDVIFSSWLIFWEVTPMVNLTTPTGFQKIDEEDVHKTLCHERQEKEVNIMGI